MKRSLTIIVIVTVVLLFTKVMAQPGYQGKKTSVKYSNLISPAWSFASSNAPAQFFNFNMTHGLSINSVVSRRSMFALKGSYGNSSIPYSLLVNGTNIYDGEVSPIKARIYTGGFEYYLFKKRAGNLAPMGGYFMTEFNLLWIALYDSKYKQSVGGVSSGNVGLWLGQQKIYYNKIILDIALGTQILLFSPDQLINKGQMIDYYYSAPDLKANTLTRIYQRNLFNLKIGVGYLF